MYDKSTRRARLLFCLRNEYTHRGSKNICLKALSYCNIKTECLEWLAYKIRHIVMSNTRSFDRANRRTIFTFRRLSTEYSHYWRACNVHQLGTCPLGIVGAQLCHSESLLAIKVMDWEFSCLVSGVMVFRSL